MNNINWGYITTIPADLMAPGDPAGDGQCEAGQWGVPVEDVIAYGTLSGLRDWAQSIVDQLPPDRNGVPLVTVDPDLLREWLETWIDEDWESTIQGFDELMEALVADLPGAGWTLGDDVETVWSTWDDYGGLMVGVNLASSEQHIGIGAPLSDDDLSAQGRNLDPLELAHDRLLMIAERINGSYR